MEFLLKDCKTGESADLRTAVSVAISRKKLEISFVAEERFRSPKYDKDNMSLYEGDVVELFLTLGSPNRYLEVEINQNNALFCAIIEIEGERKNMVLVDGRKFVNTSVTLSENEWKTVAEIDLAQLENLGFSEELVCGNLLREDFDEKGNMSIYAASPTYAETFHKPSAFVKLI